MSLSICPRCCENRPAPVSEGAMDARSCADVGGFVLAWLVIFSWGGINQEARPDPHVSLLRACGRSYLWRNHRDSRSSSVLISVALKPCVEQLKDWTHGEVRVLDRSGMLQHLQ